MLEFTLVRLFCTLGQGNNMTSLALTLGLIMVATLAIGLFTLIYLLRLITRILIRILFGKRKN